MISTWRSTCTNFSIFVHALYVSSPFRLRKPGHGHGARVRVDDHFSPFDCERKSSKISPKVYCREYIAYHKIEACTGMETQTETPSDECECNVHPSVFYLLGTLLLTSCSTAMLCAAIMTEHWEHVRWDPHALMLLANTSNSELEWLLDEKVAKISFPDHHHRGKGAFLVPMNGGIWTLCISLEDEELVLLQRVGFPERQACYNYLAGDDAAREEPPRADWQHRMQNLSISCALVCLIVLGTAALVGAFGVCQHQISAVLVTGVMYLLAGLFALFTLMIIHFKRQQQRSVSRGGGADGTADGVVGARPLAIPLLGAREFTTSWSLELGWAGVAFTTLTSVLWILLSKIMRFNPISAILL